MRRPVVAALVQTLVAASTALIGILVLSLAVERILLEDLRRTLGQFARSMAEQMDGEQQRRFITERHASAADYAAALRPLNALVKSNPDIMFAYTGIIDGNTMRYVIDVDPTTRILEADPGPPMPGEYRVWRSRQLTIEAAPTGNHWGVGLRAYAPIVDARGQMVAYVGLTMHAHRHEVALRNIRRAVLLGSAVSVLLALLSGLGVWRAQQQRNRALDQALAASRIKSQFLANMSHEIRTPMNGVLGMTELLLATPLDARQQHLARRAYESGQSLLAILNDILDFTKIEAGKLDLESVDFDLHEAVRAVAALFEADAAGRQTGLEVQIDPQVPSCVRGDPVRVRQVLINLVANGVKFTERGQVRIRVAPDPQPAATLPADCVAVQIEVSDTGLGMSESTVAQLFRPFSQADNSMTRRFGGTGLGLSIVKELVQMMGGAIAVTSAPGQGSTFRLTLALARGAERTASDAARSCGTLAAVPVMAPRAARLLLVEDNPVNRELAVAMLASMDLQCAIATNGREALQAVAANRFDAVLMDLQMPEMDGFESTAAIRGLERAAAATGSGAPRRLPIVALTANALSGDRERCLAAGMDDFLAKPYSREQLAAVLHRVLVPATPVAPAAAQADVA